METNPNLDLDGEGGAGAGASSGRSLLPKGSGRFRRSSARCSLPKGSDRFRRSLSPVNSRSLLEGRDVRDASARNAVSGTIARLHRAPQPADPFRATRIEFQVCPTCWRWEDANGCGGCPTCWRWEDAYGCGEYPTCWRWQDAYGCGGGNDNSSGCSSAFKSEKIIVIEMMADVGSPSSPGSPYSPSSPSSHRDAPSVRFSSRGIRNHKMPQCDIDRSDTEEDLYSSCEEDPYFNSLVDDFIGAATSTDLLASSPEIDYMAANQSQSLFYAESALKHYNNNDENKIKYELISAITSNAIIDRSGYGHVNFVAKGDLPDSVDEFFFAEVRWDIDSYVPVCMVSLEGKEKSGGYRDIEVDYPRGGFVGVPVDKNHCYACGDGLKHPEDGTLYESGHIASGSYYD
uniref:DUF3615 domain-containing protein n=1 Tax=Oryza rufipogon TaxID=4529 RepID=A0A0E0PD06_ORYRU